MSNLDRPLESPRHDRRNSSQDQDGRGRGRGRDYMSRSSNNNRGGGGRGRGRGRHSSVSSTEGRGRFGRGGRNDGRGRGRGRMGRGRGRFPKQHSHQDDDFIKGRNNIDFTSASNLSNNDSDMGTRGSYGEILPGDIDNRSHDAGFRSTGNDDSRGSFLGREGDGRNSNSDFDRSSFDGHEDQHYRGGGGGAGRGHGRKQEGDRSGGRGRGRYLDRNSFTRGGQNDPDNGVNTNYDSNRDRDRSFASREWQDRAGSSRDSITDRTRDWKRGDGMNSTPSSVPRFEKSYASIADDDDEEEGECREDDRGWKTDDMPFSRPPQHDEEAQNLQRHSSHENNQRNTFHRSDGNDNNRGGGSSFSPDVHLGSNQQDLPSHRPSGNSYSSFGESNKAPLISPGKDEREEGEWRGEQSSRMEKLPPPPPPPPPPNQNRDFRSQEFRTEKRPDWQPPPHHQREDSNNFRTNQNNQEWQPRNRNNNYQQYQDEGNHFRRGRQDFPSPQQRNNSSSIQHHDLRNENQDWQEKHDESREHRNENKVWQQPQQQRMDHKNLPHRDEQLRDFRNENSQLAWTPPPSQQRNQNFPRHNNENQDFRNNEKSQRDFPSDKQDWPSSSQKNDQLHQQLDHRDSRNENQDWQQQHSGEIGGNRNDYKSWQPNHQNRDEQRDLRHENKEWQNRSQQRDENFRHENKELQRSHQQRQDSRPFRTDSQDLERHEDVRVNRNHGQDWQPAYERNERDGSQNFQSTQHGNSLRDSANYGNRDEDKDMSGESRAIWKNRQLPTEHRSNSDANGSRPAPPANHYGPSLDMPPRSNSDQTYDVLGSPGHGSARRGLGSFSEMEDRGMKRDHVSPSPLVGGDGLHAKKRRMEFDHDKRDSTKYGNQYQREIDGARQHATPYENVREEITRKTSFELHEERRRNNSFEMREENRARESHNHPPLDRPEQHFLPKPPMDRGNSTSLVQPAPPGVASNQNSWQTDEISGRGEQAGPDNSHQGYIPQSTFREDGQFHHQNHYRGGGGGRSIAGRGRGFGRGRGRGRGNHYGSEGRGNYDGRGFGRGGRGGRGSFGPEGRGFHKSSSHSGFTSGPPVQSHLPAPPLPLPSADWQSSGGSYAALAASDVPAVESKIAAEGVPPSLPPEGSESNKTAINVKHENESGSPAKSPIVRMPTPPRRPPSPPPEAAPPSAFTVALGRMIDAEAQLDYAYAKHAQIIRKTKILRKEIETLEKLPVGYDAFKDDLEKLISDLEKSKADTKEPGLTALEEEEEALMEAYVNR